MQTMTATFHKMAQTEIAEIHFAWTHIVHSILSYARVRYRLRRRLHLLR